MAKPILTLEERFMQYVSPEPNTGCWLWTASTGDHGYGFFRIQTGVGQGRCFTAHRVSWSIFRGEIPPGLSVLHKCDVRPCVNPDHLFLGTRAENQLDMGRKFRGSKSKRGMPYGVYFWKDRKRPFSAKVQFKKKVHRLGYFLTQEEAHAAAVAFKRSLYEAQGER